MMGKITTPFEKRVFADDTLPELQEGEKNG